MLDSNTAMNKYTQVRKTQNHTLPSDNVSNPCVSLLHVIRNALRKSCALCSTLLAYLLFFNVNIWCTPLGEQISTYISNIKSVSCEFSQLSESNDVYLGKLFIKQGKSPKVYIEYTTGLNQLVLVNGKTVSVFDNRTGKIHTTSLSGTPIYEILLGRFDFQKNKCIIEEHLNDMVRISINKSKYGHAPLNLIFSKYSNGNLKNLIGWIIDDGKNVTTFAMDESTMRVNDPKSVPDSIFSLPSKK